MALTLPTLARKSFFKTGKAGFKDVIVVLV
jgi:hypothetical protein